MKTRGCSAGFQGARGQLLRSSGWKKHERGHGCWDAQACDPPQEYQGRPSDPRGLRWSAQKPSSSWARAALAHCLVPAPMGVFGKNLPFKKLLVSASGRASLKLK